MNRRAGLRRAAPWVLCWLSLALVLCGLALRVTYPEGVDDGVLYAAANSLSVSLVPLVGALIATRLPANPYGWLWCALGVVLGMRAVTDGLRRTDAVPAWVGEGLTGELSALLVCFVVFVFLLFPTGRLPSPAWRWLARATVLVGAILVFVLPFAPPFDDAGEPGPFTVRGRWG